MMEKEDRLSVKVGDRVRYINDCDTEEQKCSGFYPPVGTWGTVTDVDEEKEVVRVQWDSGTKPGTWWVRETDIAVLIYKEDVQPAKRGNSSQK